MPIVEYVITTHPMNSKVKRTSSFLPCLLLLALLPSALRAEIGVISPAAAKQLMDSADATKRPVVLDTRGGYKDYFRGHLPTAHHINFDTLRGTDKGVPVQYLPDDLTKALLLRAGVDANRTHLIYATGEALPNDEILSASMVAYVLEKFGVKDIRIVDGGLPAWQAAKLPTTQEYFGNPPGKLPAKGEPGIGLTLAEVLKAKASPKTLLVDARPHNEYLGNDDVWLRKGHIPGAISFHWSSRYATTFSTARNRVQLTARHCRFFNVSSCHRAEVIRRFKTTQPSQFIGVV